LDGDGLPAAALAASAAAALAALGYVMWRMLQRRDRAASEPLPLLASVDNAQSEASYDYRGLAGQMLSRARSLYDAGRGKEAHEALGHAIRLFYARRAGLRGRPTNEELLARMRQESDSSRAEYEAVRRWLAICGSVEYARYRPDSGRFNDALDEFSGVLAESAED